MKLLISLLLLATCFSLRAATVAPGLPISQYPNRGTIQGPDLFILAVTNTIPKTNMNISFNQVSNAIVSSIPAGIGFAAYETMTNSARVSLGTNVNWVSGVTGALSGTVTLLGVDISSITSGLATVTFVTNSIVGFNAFKTNQFTTNVADVANNIQTPVQGSLWFRSFGSGQTGGLTNGARPWSMEFTPSNGAFRVGALGTTASVSNYWDVTNVGFGSVAFGTNVKAIGTYSFVQGMMNLVATNSVGSSITGGSNNTVGTNAFVNHIGGGHLNVIGDNYNGGTIGGGANNALDPQVSAFLENYGVIAGGIANRVRLEYGSVTGGKGNDVRTIGGSIIGGLNNQILDGDYSTIGGGESSTSRGDWSFIGGGHLNNIWANAGGINSQASTIAGGDRNNIGSASTLGSDYSFIGGGLSNLVKDVADFSVIGGGLLNQTGGGGNAVNFNTIGGGVGNITDDLIDAAFIGGGINNKVGGDFGFIVAGVSNSTTAAYAAAIGNFITNTTTKSVEIGITNLSKMRVEAFSTRMIGMGTLYQSNSFAMPAAATIGVGGYWVGNSNGVLVSIKSLDGTTTVMKILDQ